MTRMPNIPSQSSALRRLLVLAVVSFSINSIAESGSTNANASGTLRAAILDSTTRKPTPCSVTITDVNGKIVVQNRSYTAGFRSNGEFVQTLPPGKTRVRVTRGFETRVIERFVDIRPNETAELRLTLERVVDMRARGWYAGDSHVHMLHGEKTLPVSFDDVALAARAEDLQYLSLAQAWSLDSPTPERLDAELKSRSTPDCVLTWNLEAPKNYYRGDAGRCLGHCWMLGVNGRTSDGLDVIGLLMQASAHDYESEKPTFANFESHQLIHAQEGAAFYTHPARWWTGEWGGQGGYPKQEKMRVSNMAVELPLDTLLGPTFDGVDILTGSGEFGANAMAFDLWCLLLNHGYRVACTASSDSCFDRPGGGVPGVVRTYTFLPDGFTLPGAARATATGNTFVTSGPLLLTTVDGRPPGSVFRANGKSRSLSIQAWASGADPKGLSRLEILRNGKTLISTPLIPLFPTLSTNVPLSDSESAWYCVRVFGSDPQRQRAISGAFFFDSRPFKSPEPMRSHVRITIQDDATGQELAGTITEVTFQGPLALAGRRHDVRRGKSTLDVPAICRLRAAAPGYEPATQSLFLDNPALLSFITSLSAEDLVNWTTFEHVRSLLQDVPLTFRLKRNAP